MVQNRLNQQFEATKPNQIWLTDITYIRTTEGWLYPVAVLDLFSRRIVGWSMDARMTEALTHKALEMAVASRQKIPDNLLHHSDRGSQYTLGHLFALQVSIQVQGGNKTPDYIFCPDEIRREEIQSLAGPASEADLAGMLAVGDAKAWGRPLDRTLPGGGIKSLHEHPGLQIDFYIRHSGLDWGILDNYKVLLSRTLVFAGNSLDTTFLRAIVNSILLAVGQTIPAVLLASLVGFIFAKRDFPGKNGLFIAVLLTMMLPYQATIVPFFLLMVKLEWINTFWPLWLPWWTPAFGIFLMRQIIAATVPDSLMDAATIDGASLLTIYWRIVLPLVKPGLAVLGILNFMNAWNDYIYSNIVLNETSMFTTPLLLALFKGSQIAIPEYGILAAGSVLSTIPLLIVFFVFQRWLVSGIMSGATKG